MNITFDVLMESPPDTMNSDPVSRFGAAGEVLPRVDFRDFTVSKISMTTIFSKGERQGRPQQCGSQVNDLVIRGAQKEYDYIVKGTFRTEGINHELKLPGFGVSYGFTIDCPDTLYIPKDFPQKTHWLGCVS